MKFAVASMPPLLMAGTRYGLAGGLLYAAMRLRGEPRPTWRGWGHGLLIGICLLGFGNGGTTFGVLYLPSGTTSLLVATVPTFLALLGWLSGITPRPTRWVSLGLAAGLGGMYRWPRIPARPGVPRPGHPEIGVLAGAAGGGDVVGGLAVFQEAPARPLPFPLRRHADAVRRWGPCY